MSAEQPSSAFSEPRQNKKRRCAQFATDMSKKISRTISLCMKCLDKEKRDNITVEEVMVTVGDLSNLLSGASGRVLDATDAVSRPSFPLRLSSKLRLRGVSLPDDTLRELIHDALIEESSSSLTEQPSPT